MDYRIRCDDCAFDRETDDWITASAWARDHEADHPTHHVSLVRDDPG